ncbi:MAG: hypothetical protein ACRDAW_00815 [Metamycoplasmataceae bacterium]
MKNKNQNTTEKNIKKNKRIKQVLPVILSSSFVGLSAIMVATSIGLSTQNVQNNLSANNQLSFDNKLFKNKAELIEYAQSNFFQGIETTDNRINWSIDEKGKKLYFNDPKLLRDHLLSKIKQTSALSSKKLNLNTGGLGEISDNDFSKLYFNKTEDQLKTNIYRGKNNSIHRTIESAKDSYLSIHDAYYFNNIYFRNIEELKLYLKTVYYVPNGPGWDKANTTVNIGLVGPTGVVSSGINKNDLYYSTPDPTAPIDPTQKANTDKAKKDFINNINNQAMKFIQFEKNNDEYFYVKEGDLNNPNAELLNAFNNPEYTRQYSNGGKSSYIVDLHKDDKNTLFGPYYLQTSGAIDGITDHNNWKPVDRDDPLITTEQNSNILSGFLDLILFDNGVESGVPLNIEPLNHILNPFYNLLINKNKNVYDKWLALSKEIKNGKRNNTFFNLPIYYFFLIENLINDGANQKVIMETKKVFNSIAKYLDETIKILLPKELLEKNQNNINYGQYLSFEKIFNFNSNDTDLNSDISYYINEISSNFSQFIVAINIINQAMANAMYNGGVLPYKQEYIKRILKGKSDIVKDNKEMKTIYEKVWNIFSSTSINDLKGKISNLKHSNKIINGAFLDNLITNISVTNSIFASAEKFLFEDNFKNIKLSTDAKGKTLILNDPYKFLADFKTNTNDSVLKKLVSAQNELTWENFMLIKFVYKSISSIPNEINFVGNQDELKVKLINKINTLSLENYAKNFIIQPTISNGLISASSSNSIADFRVFFEVLNKTSKAINVIDDILDNIKEIGEGTLDAKKADLLLSKILSSPILSSVAKAIPYMQIALIAIDLVKGAFIPVTIPSSYKFELDQNNSFIWNGGQSTTMFWGLAEISSVTIKDMKLLKPQQIVKPNNKETLYFNGKKYSETNLVSLKIDQLRAILNGEFSTNNATVVYSFDNISTNDKLAIKNEKAFENLGTIDDLTLIAGGDNKSLVKYIYEMIYQGLNSKDPKHPGKKYYKDKFIFANGSVSNSTSDTIEMLTTKVIDKIQPVKIATLPIIKDNKPIYNNSGNEEDGSVSSYVLPSVSWSAGRFFTNRTNNKYIIFDPNQESDNQNPGPGPKNNDIESNIKQLFYAYFDVDYKTVIEKEIISNNDFSDLSSSIISNVIFQVKLDNNLTKYFFDQGSAFNWLLSQSNFTLYSYNSEKPIYKYKDIIFQSRDEFIKFILEKETVEVE